MDPYHPVTDIVATTVSALDTIQTLPYTNEKNKPVKGQTSCFPRRPLPLIDIVPVAGTKMELKPESKYLCYQSRILSPSSESVPPASKTIEATEGQANNSGASDNAKPLPGLGQPTDIKATLIDAFSTLNNSNASLSALNMLFALVGQKELGGNDHPEFPGLLLFFSEVLLERATIPDSALDANHVIECLTKAAHATKGDPARRIMILSTLVTAHSRRFERHGQATDINTAVEYLYATLASAGDNHEHYALFMAGLGGLLGLRYEAFMDLDDLEKAIQYQTRALASISETADSHADILSTLGCSYQLRFERLGDREDINSAMKCHIQAIQLTPVGHLDMPVRFSNLGNSHSCRFERLGKLEDINRAIECQTRAVQLAPEGHSDMPTLFNDLGSSYSRRFERSGELEDISRGIECHNQAVQLTPIESLDMPCRLSNLGNSCSRRYERLAEPGDINRAIECQSRAAQLIPEGHPDIPDLFNNLGNSYSRRFERLEELEDLSRGIECHNQAVQLTPGGHPDMPSRLCRLGSSYRCRFERLGGVKDLSKVIECHNQAVQLTPEGHPDMPIGLCNLGYSHRCRFELLGELEDISRAIESLSQGIHLTRMGHSDMPLQLSNLGDLYRCRFQRLGELEDMSKSIECHIQAIHLTPVGHPHTPARLNNLGISYLSRFERSGEFGDTSRAIECHNQAVQLTPEGHPDKHVLFNSLGNSYQARYECLGELEDIGRAIEYHNQAVQLIPEGHPSAPSLFSSLGNSYNGRFERLGDLEDISKAIECLLRAVELTSQGHPHMPLQLRGLSSSYLRRFTRLGELEDVKRAIECQSQAIKLTPEGHTTIPVQLTDLAGYYVTRHRRSANLKDVNTAMQLLAQASSLTPDGHSILPGILSALSAAYLSRTRHGVDNHDIHKAVQFSYQAVTATPDKHAAKPVKLFNLGNDLLVRFHRLKEPEDIESAISAYTQALALLPQTHEHTSAFQDALGRSYAAHWRHFTQPQYFLKALDHLETAARSSTGPPSVRFQASQGWASLLSKPVLSASLPAQRIIMHLLSKVIWLGTTSARRYERITEVGAVAVEAAAAAISASDYGLALEWLEKGRSIVWNQTLQLRNPVDDLAKVDPELAQSLEQVSRDLERASWRASNTAPFEVTTMNSEQVTIRHHRLVAQYDHLFSKARALPGFHDFLRPKKAADLVHAARSGPIVVVNVYTERCDALIVSSRPDKIAHIPLPNLSRAVVDQWYSLMLKALRAKRVRERVATRLKDLRGDQFDEVLTALWHKLVKPILDFLGYTNKLPVDQLPRITWCTTGPLSFLPIHAAGCYGSGGDRIFEFATTSYTPTLSALLPTRSQSPTNVSGVLAVSQESTPGMSLLPGTKEELVHIKNHVGSLPYMQLEGDQATPEAVLDAMENYECVHLACHGSQDTDDPTKSSFHLHGGTLSLKEIGQRSLKNKKLAFLSACQTATGDQKMPDEAIHLAAGMLVAGYPSVIATMWSINDRDAPLVADQVYGQLIQDGKLDCSQVGRALHIAVGALRDKVGEKAFSRWVPYIHIGV